MRMTPLAQARAHRGLTQRGVAAAVFVDPGHYCRVEGAKTPASPELAARLAFYFDHVVTEMEILYPERYIQRDPTTQPDSAELR